MITRFDFRPMPYTIWLVLLSMIHCFCSKPVQADFIISVDFDPITNGIQNTRTVQQGQSISANLILQYNEPVGLDSYRFSVQFNDAAMSFVSATRSAIVDFSHTSGPPSLSPPTTIGPFEAASNNLFAGPTNITPTIVGSVTFSAESLLGSFAITPFEDELFDASFNNNADQVTPQFNAGIVTITAVPEPSALVYSLIALNLLSLHRRRRQNGHRPPRENRVLFCQHKPSVTR